MNRIPKNLLEIVNKWRKAGAQILDDDAEKVWQLCNRKMQFVKTDDPEGYMEMLFDDEVKWKLVFGKQLNTDSMAEARRIPFWGPVCV